MDLRRPLRDRELEGPTRELEGPLQELRKVLEGMGMKNQKGLLYLPRIVLECCSFYGVIIDTAIRITRIGIVFYVVVLVFVVVDFGEVDQRLGG